MKFYAVRKRLGRWTVCSNDNVVLHFENFAEAIDTAQGAVAVMLHSQGRPVAAYPTTRLPVTRDRALQTNCLL